MEWQLAEAKNRFSELVNRALQRARNGSAAALTRWW